MAEEAAAMFRAHGLDTSLWPSHFRPTHQPGSGSLGSSCERCSHARRPVSAPGSAAGRRLARVAGLAVVDRTVDGTPLYAARGELSVDVDEQCVQCHFCGGWYRALAPTHLARAHGVTADEYRARWSVCARAMRCGRRF